MSELGWLGETGVYFRGPGGNVENVADQRPVVEWAAWNIGRDPGVDGDPAVWKRSRELWDAAGITHFPWLHCHSIPDIERLIAVAWKHPAATGQRAIGLNLEDVFNDGIDLKQVAQVLDDQWDHDVHVATLPVVQHVPGWNLLKKTVFALEIFPDENDESTRPAECIEIAFQQIGPQAKVTLMLKTKEPLLPSSYGEFFKICHSLYTGDDITPTPSAWAVWRLDSPCVVPKPPSNGGPMPPAPPPLTKTQVPFTGPYGRPDTGLHAKGPTAKALKRMQIRLGNLDLDLAKIDEHYNAKLDAAMEKWQREIGITPVTGNYGRKSWVAARAALVPEGRPHAGEHALDGVAQKLIRDEVELGMVFPFEDGVDVSLAQGLHETGGLNENWALDWKAPIGSVVLAPEAGRIVRLSGSPMNQDVPDPAGVAGFSIHLETPMFYRYFFTHFGDREVVEDEIVEAGQPIGTLGDQKFRIDHIHGGVTSPKGEADAKARIMAVHNAPRIVLP